MHKLLYKTKVFPQSLISLIAIRDRFKYLIGEHFCGLPILLYFYYLTAWTLYE